MRHKWGENVLNKTSSVNVLHDVHTGLIHQGLLQVIQDLVFIVKVFKGNSFRYIYINDIGMKHTGLNESCFGKTFQQALPEDVAKVMQEQYEMVINGKEAVTFRDSITLPKQEVLHYESSLNPIFNEYGACEYIVCITRDITAQVHEKIEIQERQILFKSLLEYNDEAILSVDVNGYIMYVNPAIHKVLGYSEWELKNKCIFSYVKEEARRTFQSIFEEALKGKAKQITSYKYEHRNGYELYISFKTVPIIVNKVVTGVYIIMQDTTKQVLQELKTTYLAYYDQLTGLLNQSSYMEMLAQFLQIKKDFTLIMMDLDEFNLINETFGHESGDDILKKVSRRLRELSPKGAHLFRDDGDKFVILLEHIEQLKIEKFVTRILQGLQQHFVVNGYEVFLNAAIGIVKSSDGGKDEQTLLKWVNIALERAKGKGKGNYSFYCNKLNMERSRRFILENKLHKALERSEFVLHYQPQVNIETEEIIGMEALLRWYNEDFGNVPPSEFIPVAEKTGFIIKIDEWVLEEVCRQLREWINKGYKPVPIAINISAKHFRSSKLIDTVIRVLEMYSIPRNLITIEITEGALMNTKQSEAVLQQLKENELNIHLDDFGTGYSSLSYLNKYPIDTLKIDRSFMKEVNLSEKGEKITTIIIHLAHTLGLNVIAEGVEEIEQIQFLKDKNAVYAQGYYFNKPLSVHEVEMKYLKERKK